MRSLLLVMSLSLCLAHAQSGIPKDAVKQADDTYTHTDKSGKKWRYRQGPFGVQKIAESDLPAAIPQTAPTPADSGFKVVSVDAEQATFERRGAFGPQRQSIRLVELSKEQREAVDRFQSERNKGAAKQ